MEEGQHERGGLEGLAALCLASGPFPSFGSLPVELRLKCLASCDWQTLSRVACASRSARALVSGGTGPRRGRVVGAAADVHSRRTNPLLLFEHWDRCILLALPQVSYLVRTPYWRTHSEEQPAVLTTDFATEEERARACDKWARDLAQQLCGHGKPDLCFVFLSARRWVLSAGGGGGTPAQGTRCCWASW